MKTLFKLALIGAFTAVLVKMARRSTEDSIPTVNPMKDWQPDAADPLRGENLNVEPASTH